MLPWLRSCSSGYSELRFEQLFPVAIRVSVAIGCLSAGFTPMDGVHPSVKSSQATPELCGVDVRSLGGFCPGVEGDCPRPSSHLKCRMPEDCFSMDRISLYPLRFGDVLLRGGLVGCVWSGHS